MAKPLTNRWTQPLTNPSNPLPNSLFSPSNPFYITPRKLDINTLKAIFEAAGGQFLWPAARIIESLQQTRVLVFDWDGVFTDGRKDQHKNSTYSELDTMGINMLRFGLWLETGQLPAVFIVTGEENPTAWKVAQRDHFMGVYYGVKNKSMMGDKILAQFNLSVDRSLFFFDDILDLSLVRLCGMTIGLSNPSMPLFRRTMSQETTCAYLSGRSGGSHGIRETCEMLLGLLGRFDEVVEQRTHFSESYRRFLLIRDEVSAQLL